MPEVDQILARVRARLAAHGLTSTIRAFPEGTHTAEDAAHAVNCALDQIAKSIVFEANHAPLVVIAAGSHRIDKSLVGSALGTKLRSVGADYLREQLDLEPGGVSPLATEPGTPTLVDATLLTFERVWLSAGTPNHVVNIGVNDLITITGARVLSIAAPSQQER